VTVVWRAAAHADLLRLIRYIAAENPVAARQAARELMLAADSLTTFPRRGRPGRVQDTRELVVISPYILVYEVDAQDRVTILRVWHAAQDRP